MDTYEIVDYQKEVIHDQVALAVFSGAFKSAGGQLQAIERFISNNVPDGMWEHRSLGIGSQLDLLFAHLEWFCQENERVGNDVPDIRIFDRLRTRRISVGHAKNADRVFRSMWSALSVGIRAYTNARRGYIDALIDQGLVRGERVVTGPFSREFFASLGDMTYERILPITENAPLQRDITADEFESLSGPEQQMYTRIESSREFYRVRADQIEALNKRIQFSRQTGESQILLMPTCPPNPYMVEHVEERGWVIRAIPGRHLSPYAINHTAYTAMYGAVPFVTMMMENDVTVDIRIGTGAEEHQKGNDRGMKEQDFMMTLNTGHPFMLTRIAQEFGEDLEEGHMAVGTPVNHLQRFSVQGLCGGRLDMMIDSLTGLSGGSEYWQNCEARALAKREEFWSNEAHRELIDQILAVREKFYSFVLAQRYGIMETWDHDVIPTFADFTLFLQQHYQKVIVQESGRDVAGITDKEIEVRYQSEIEGLLQSDVDYYCTFHLMGLELWGEQRLNILAADSRSLHVLASAIVGTDKNVFVVFGNYEGADEKD